MVQATTSFVVERLESDETLEGQELTQLLAPVVPAPPVATNGSGRKRATAGARSRATSKGEGSGGGLSS